MVKAAGLILAPPTPSIVLEHVGKASFMTNPSGSSSLHFFTRSGSVGSGIELAPLFSTDTSSTDLDLSRSRGVEADADRPLE
eukprot:2859835-Amphidinium_carterae.1